MTADVLNNTTHRFVKLTKAFELAARIHHMQYRKSTSIPYISHLMSVSALIFENGGTEVQAIAGLLHDAIEDADPPSMIPQLREIIARDFGNDVLEIVDACTDAVPDSSGNKGAWKDRKEAYLKRLMQKPPYILLVSCCDKLHNAKSILNDLNNIGVSVFERFSSPKEQTLWYYQSLAEIYANKLIGQPGEIAAKSLSETVAEIKRKAI